MTGAGFRLRPVETTCYRSCSTPPRTTLKSARTVPFCQVVPRASRRRLATLIRIRQEVDKRLDRVVPQRRGPAALETLLTPGLASVAESADGDALRRTLAAAARQRFPLKHLEGRDPGTLPGRAALARSIDDAIQGRWSVFGTPLVVDAAQHEWTRHPTSRVLPSRLHWTRVSYMEGIGGGDVKCIWELSRHHHLLRLAQGYYLDRTESAAEQLLALLESWIDENPNGIGINWTSSLEVAFRAIAWCWLWALTCDSGAWTPTRVRRFLLSLWHHARHIERFDSIHHSPNTHLTGEGLGLLYVGSLFPEFRRASDWSTLGRNILHSELGIQVLSDGMHYERSVGYHKYTAEFYLHYLLLARAFGLPEASSIRDSVRAQTGAAGLLRRPDGTWPVIGDEDSGDTLLLAAVDPQDQGPLLAVSAGLFQDAELLALTSDAHRAAGWWLLDASEWQWMRDSARESLGSARRPGSRAGAVGDAALGGALPAAGYFIGREDDSDTAWWCLVDAGPHGGDGTGHAHTDLGHVEIARGSTHVVVDPGCAGYTIARAARDHARSEAAHACLVVNGAPLAVPAGSFSWARLAPTPRHRWGDDGQLWWCELSYDRTDPSGALAHRRQVVLVRGTGVVVCDWISGAPGRSFALHWPLGAAPNDVDLSDHGITNADYAIAWSASSGRIDASSEPTTRAPGYGRQTESALLRLALHGPLPVSIVTCFTNRGAQFGRHVHDGEAVRLGLPANDGRQALVLSVRPEAAPSLVAVPAPASSLPVTR